MIPPHRSITALLLLSAITTAITTACHSAAPAPSPDIQRADGPLPDGLLDGAEAGLDGKQGDGPGKGGKVAVLLLMTDTDNVGGLHAFDLTTQKDLATLSLSLDKGGESVMRADGSQLLVANGEAGELLVFDVWQGQSVSFLPADMVDVGYASRRLALHPSGDTAFRG